MHTLREQGKIRVVGTSATPAESIVEAQWIAERRGVARVRSEQCIYSIFARGIERAVLPACQRFGLGVMVYAPLGGGWLTGKYRRGAEAPEGSRAKGFWNRTGRWDPARSEVQHKYDLVEALEAMAREAGLPLAHVAMAFASEHPGISSAIIGPRTFAQAEELLRGLELSLAPAVLDRIDALVPPGSDLDARDTTVSIPALEDARLRRRSR
jgi:aryl-alcohol dehydrogenase-like predicted oxidoreductase